MNFDPLTRPVRAEHREGILLKGYVLVLAAGLLVRTGFPLLAVLALVPATIVGGYLATLFTGEWTTESTLPPFGNVSTLARRGTLALVVGVVYLAIPLGLLLVTLRGARSATLTPEVVGFVTGLWVFGGATVILLVSLALAFLYPAAVAESVRLGTFRAALPGKRLRARCVDRHYFVGWFASVVVSGVGAAVLSWLVPVGSAGTVVGLAGWYYAQLIAAATVGSAYARSADL